MSIICSFWHYLCQASFYSPGCCCLVLKPRKRRSTSTCWGDTHLYTVSLADLKPLGITQKKTLSVSSRFAWGKEPEHTYLQRNVIISDLPREPPAECVYSRRGNSSCRLLYSQGSSRRGEEYDLNLDHLLLQRLCGLRFIAKGCTFSTCSTQFASCPCPHSMKSRTWKPPSFIHL